MKKVPDVPWWEAIERCRAMVVVGKGNERVRRRCRNRCLAPYERQKGDLVVPLYCRWHIANGGKGKA